MRTLTDHDMTRTTSTVLAALALLALGACSAGQDSTSTAPAASTTQASAASGDAVRNDKAESGPRGDCDLLSAAEIEQAFGNTLRVTHEPVPVGTEAYLVNGGQVIAVDAGGRSISVGLMLLVFDGNAPVPAAEVASGVQSLARLALERL